MTEGAFVWLAVITGGQVLSIISNIASMRRNPPLAEELYKQYATREDLKQLRAEFLATSGEIFSVLRKLKDEITASTSGLNAQVSRLDGILSRCPGPDHCAKEAAARGSRP